MNIKKTILLIGIQLFWASSLPAEIRLPALIQNNMVLQQDTNVTIWGWADPGEKVAVKGDWHWFDKKTTADDNGDWQVQIKTRQADLKPHSIKIKGANDQTIMIDNILFGEVWLCSGQSNMQWTLEMSIKGPETIKNADYPSIRHFTLEAVTAEEPKKDTAGQWQLCTPESIKHFSAVGFYFGRYLHEQLNVPIGLIDNAWGGTPAQSWVKKEVIESRPEYQYYLKLDQDAQGRQYEEQKQYDAQLETWEEQVKLANENGTKPPRKPFPPSSLRPQNRCARLYNSLIAPITNYTIKGAIWYQGESNGSEGYLYQKLFADLITSWREEWGIGDFPFYFVQLANFYQQRPDNPPDHMPVNEEPARAPWAELREAQTKTLELPNTGMAVAIDIGEPYDIHPRNKYDVGKRLALWALAHDYGKTLVYSGPLYREYKIEGDKIRIFFDHTAKGLKVDGNELKAFEIASDDQKFVWADAKIDGDSVLVWSEEVNNPVAVRYGWSIWTYANLFNSEGLPASPFRTDTWPTEFEKKIKETYEQ